MNEINYSLELVNAIQDYLISDNWNFSFDDQKGLFRFSVRLKGKIKSVDYVISVKENEYIVYAVSPLGGDKNDEKNMAEIAKFICRANFGMRNGSFEFDMEDGEIRFKVFVACNNLIPSNEIIERSIICPATMFDLYADGLIKVICGYATAGEAIEDCEDERVHGVGSLIDESEQPDEEDTQAVMELLTKRLGIDEDDEDTEEEFGLGPDFFDDAFEISSEDFSDDEDDSDN